MNVWLANVHNVNKQYGQYNVHIQAVEATILEVRE
jgi:hypothetical protein